MRLESNGERLVRAVQPSTPEDFFRDHPGAMVVYSRVRAVVGGFGPVQVRVSRSQVAFRRDRAFAYLWLPGRWLRHPAAEVVLSVPLDRPVDSPRIKEVAHASPRVWMHHLELRDAADVDEEVASWLAEAYRQAGPPPVAVPRAAAVLQREV